MSKTANGVKITNKAKEAIEEKNRRLKVVARAIGMDMEGEAKVRTPVLTGALKNSITHAETGDAERIYTYTDDCGKSFTEAIGAVPDEPDILIIVGTNKEYGPKIEVGDATYTGKHMLRDAVSSNGDKYISWIKHVLEGDEQFN